MTTIFICVSSFTESVSAKTTVLNRELRNDGWRDFENIQLRSALFPNQARSLTKAL